MHKLSMLPSNPLVSAVVSQVVALMPGPSAASPCGTVHPSQTVQQSLLASVQLFTFVQLAQDQPLNRFQAHRNHVSGCLLCGFFVYVQCARLDTETMTALFVPWASTLLVTPRTTAQPVLATLPHLLLEVPVLRPAQVRESLQEVKD